MQTEFMSPMKSGMPGQMAVLYLRLTQSDENTVSDAGLASMRATDNLFCSGVVRLRNLDALNRLCTLMHPSSVQVPDSSKVAREINAFWLRPSAVSMSRLPLSTDHARSSGNTVWRYAEPTSLLPPATSFPPSTSSN